MPFIQIGVDLLKVFCSFSFSFNYLGMGHSFRFYRNGNDIFWTIWNMPTLSLFVLRIFSNLFAGKQYNSMDNLQTVLSCLTWIDKTNRTLQLAATGLFPRAVAFLFYWCSTRVEIPLKKRLKIWAVSAVFQQDLSGLSGLGGLFFFNLEKRLKPLKSCLKNRSKTAHFLRWFLNGFSSKIWAVFKRFLSGFWAVL